MNVDDPKSIEYYSILRQALYHFYTYFPLRAVRGSQNKSRIRQQWLYGPEPPILRGTVGSTAFVIKNDIYMVSGWEHISKRYCLDSEKSYSVSTIQF